MRFKAVTVGLVLAGTALGSTALTLGRARGAAWIGQALDLQVPVQLDPGQTDTTLCAEADVFHGDMRQDAGRIQVRTEAGSQADSINLRITSSSPIDEPVVTVYLQAGCGQKSSRKYVLLADFPPEPANAPVRVTPPPPQVPTIVAPAMAIDNAQSPPVTPAVAAPAAEPKAVTKAAATAPQVATKEQIKVPKPQPPKKLAPPPAPKPEKPAETSAPPKTSNKPRLRLDPVETLAERVKTLEATTIQSSLQDEQSREAQKLQQLQSDLRTLLDQAVKNEASLSAMRERLEKAEAGRVPIALVYGLVALVALCVGALAFLWTRRNRPVRWEDDDASPSPAAPSTASQP